MGADTGRIYICIDLKSFYASVECADRRLDPFLTNLVVADPTRTEKTICLAVTPALKKQGVRNRCRLFEIPSSLTYYVIQPRMRHYMEKSAQIYSIYLRFVSKDDIHIYSVDECFIDVTPYLALYQVSARQFARSLIDEVFRETRITATAGIGTNLFLCKVALDISAKHAEDGIGYIDEEVFYRTIWDHRPITDIWNIGPGIARRLLKYGVRDLHGIALMPRQVLYKEFGVNAELLIDHSHGIEPCTIPQIRAYRPKSSSLNNGQVLACSYSADEALIIAREMCEESVLELVQKRLAAGSIGVYIGYGKQQALKPGALSDKNSTTSHQSYFIGEHSKRATGPSPKSEYGSASRKLSRASNSLAELWPQLKALYWQTVAPSRDIRRISITFGNLIDENLVPLDLFSSAEDETKEKSLARTQLSIKNRFGKNAVFKAGSLREKATALERNQQIGGHHE